MGTEHISFGEVNMSDLIIAQDTQILVDSWLEAELNGEQFPVPFDLAWQIAGYSTKANAKRKLMNKDYFEQGEAFIISDERSLHKDSGSYSIREDIKISVNAFKEFCMLSKSEIGKATRRYFIEAEKRWKMVQQQFPEVAFEVEESMTQIQILQNAIAVLVEQEQRQKQLEAAQKQMDARIAKIETERLEATYQLEQMPYPTVPIPPKTTRMLVRQLVNNFCNAKGVRQKDVFRKLYQELYYRCGINITERTKKNGQSYLEIVEELNLTDQLYAIASEVLI